MRKTITLIFLSISFCTHAQLFTGTGGNIQNNGVETYFNLAIFGLSPAALSSTFGIEEVCINISHPTVEELYIYLESPNGRRVELSEGTSCKGVDYLNTCFDSKAGTSITLSIAPHSGTFRPMGYLGRFNVGDAANGTWKLIVKDYLAFVNSGSLISWSIKFGNATVAPVSFSSSNLPIVIINTNNQGLSDSKIMVDMGVIYNGSQRNYLTDVRNNYNGKAAMNIRGNSSKYFEKKPFAIETRDAAGNDLAVFLLGMPPESDWSLIASYTDKSLTRNPLAYDLFRRMGHYSSRFKNVEVVIDDEYRGVYALVEKPKRDQYRIDISKLTSTDNAFPNITGGYILKIDRSTDAGWYSFLPGNAQNNAHFYYQYVYPKDSDITSAQDTYIKSYMDDFETVMSSASYNDPVTGYQQYIDVNSFVDFLVINELGKNPDAYKLSTYLYKDNISVGGKLHIGPVWDYDLSWHNCNYGNAFDPAGWQYQIPDTVNPSPNWWSRLMQDTYFVNKLYCRWNELRQNTLNLGNLYAYIDSSATVLNESQQRNFMQWPIMGAYIYPNPQNQLSATYQGEVNDLKTWIANRISWLDAAIAGQCPAIGVKEKDSAQNNIIVYPNPFNSIATFEMYLAEEADVTLSVVDLMGKEVAQLLSERRSVGNFKVTFDKKETAPGLYFYQWKINNTVKTGKIIIQ